MSRPVPSRLVASGVVELAAGPLSGWVYTSARTQPELAGQLGIRSTTRVRQWHLYLVLLGSATVAAGLAVPSAPSIASASFGIGAWTNAMAFLPLAFKPDIDKHPAFIACTAGSFVATTIGFTGMAAACIQRRRRRPRTA